MAVFRDTEKKKSAFNKGKSQNKYSLKRVNEYIVQDEKVGEVELDKIGILMKEKSDRIFKYISDKNKTNTKLVTGINCSPTSAYDEMMVTKHMYNKTKGRQFKHFVHSYSILEKDLTPEIAHEISLKLAEHEKFKDFQMVLATHTDTNHIHTHFVINSVNTETGKKWQHTTKDIFDIINYSNELCQEYGLKYSFANTKSNKHSKNKYKSMGELKAKEKGQSWKYETWLTINEVKKISTSREEFIENLERLNYKVRWVDERKNITFTLPNGRKLNNDKLYPVEKFTKGGLEKQFQLNKEFQERKLGFESKVKSENLQEIYFKTMKFLFENPDEGDKNYPMTYLEGQALKEKMIEEAKGRGMDFREEQERR